MEAAKEAAIFEDVEFDPKAWINKNFKTPGCNTVTLLSWCLGALVNYPNFFLFVLPFTQQALKDQIIKLELLSSDVSATLDRSRTDLFAALPRYMKRCGC